MHTTYDADKLASYFDGVSFSYLMHKGQNRRDLGIPYWVHVALVSSTIAEWGGDHIQVIAGLTHDVVEDTDIDSKGFHAVMGGEVGSVVDGLTANKDPSKSWRERKLEYLDTFINEEVDPRCYLDKLADMHANMTSFTNTMVRTGHSTAKANTINSYVALSHVCMGKLIKFGTTSQYQVARFNMERMFDRVRVVGLSDAELLHDVDFNVDDAVVWRNKLKQVWDMPTDS